jgi:hypothetical protein
MYLEGQGWDIWRRGLIYHCPGLCQEGEGRARVETRQKH